LWEEHVPERLPEQLHVWSLQRAVGLPHDTLAGTFAEPHVALAGSGVGRGVGRGVGAGAGGCVVAGGAAASVVDVVGGVVAGGLVVGGLLAVVGELPPPHDARNAARITALDRFTDYLRGGRAREGNVSGRYPFGTHYVNRTKSEGVVVRDRSSSGG
jgi:hypothetical protein